MIIREQMTVILKAVCNIQDLCVLNGRQSDLQRTAELWRGMANDLAATLNRLQTRWDAWSASESKRWRSPTIWMDGLGGRGSGMKAQ